MAKPSGSKKAPAKPAGEEKAGATVAPPTPVSSNDPKAIAEGFKEAVKAVEVEQNVALKATGAKVPAAGGGGGVAPSLVVPATSWTPEGIGRAGVHLTNLLLGAGDFELLEPDEEKGLAEDVAYYLNARWPSGSAWEPEMRLVGRVAEVAGPRFAARWKAQRDEAARLETEAEELEDQADRNLGVPRKPAGPVEVHTMPVPEGAKPADYVVSRR